MLALFSRENNVEFLFSYHLETIWIKCRELRIEGTMIGSLS